MHQKPLEEIQYGDVEDYDQILTSEDLEDLLKSESPRLRYGRSIAREFYEQGRVEAKAAEEYGLVYVPVSLDTDVLHFPKACVNHPESLRAQMNDRINKAPKIISKVVEKKVRGWINPQSGEFFEFDQRAVRQEQLSNYSALENADFCFCQMCEQPKRKEYIEVTCIQQEPAIFLPQIYLSLCLECSKRFQGLRSTKKSAFSKELTDKILSTKINGSGNVTIDMEGYISLKFTETHFAEIQAAISRLKLKESVSGIARPEPVSAVNEGRVVQPATHHAAVPKSFVCEDGGADKLAPAPNTATIRVHGEDAGLYKLVAYNGRLKKYTDKKPESRFIPLLRSGKERKVAVSLIREEQTIYISKENYVVFGKQLCQADDIELRYGAS